MKSKEEIEAIHDLLANIGDCDDLARKLTHSSIFSRIVVDQILTALPVLCWILGHGKEFPEKIEILKDLFKPVGYDIVDNKLVQDGKSLINSKPHLN